MLETAATKQPKADPRSQQLESFRCALDALRKEVEAELGPTDAEHIRKVRRVSSGLEIAGRSLIHLSLEPVGFSLGVSLLWAHKCLELMEIGHMALHGAFDDLPDVQGLTSKSFLWKAPIDEQSWMVGHNVRHHSHTNVAGSDPDMSFAVLRLSPRIPYRALHRLQPISNLATWLGFGVAIQLHVTGFLERHLTRAEDRSHDQPAPSSAGPAQKLLRYYGREYVLFPALAGPFFWKVVLGNALSELGRDLYSAATIYCGHVGAKDYPPGTRAKGRAEWYVMQVEAARNLNVPLPLSILSGALDKQIEHHLFPRLPPNRLREIAPRVQRICEEHGVRYLADSWPATLRDVLSRLRAMSSLKA